MSKYVYKKWVMETGLKGVTFEIYPKIFIDPMSPYFPFFGNLP